MPSMSKGRVERRRMRSRRRTTWPILISCWRSTTSGPLLESLSNFGPLQKKHLHIASNIKQPKAVISHQGSSGGGLEALVKSAQQTIVDFQQVPLHLIYEKNTRTKTAMRATADHAYLSFLSLPLFLWIGHFSFSTCDRWLVPDVDELRPYQSPAGNQLPLWIRVGDTASLKNEYFYWMNMMVFENMNILNDIFRF